MSWAHIVAVRDWPVDHTAKLVGFALASYANHAGRAWPSQTTLAHDAGVSVRTVQRALGRLAAAKLVTVGTRGRGRPCGYLLSTCVTVSPTYDTAVSCNSFESKEGIFSTADITARLAPMREVLRNSHRSR